jgi:hypothetical protein
MVNQQPKRLMWYINRHLYLGSLAVVVLLASAGELFAQQYQVVPNDSIVSNTPFNDLTHFNITQTNLSGNKLVFSWRQISLSVPAGWTANLCDNGNCYTDFPVSGTMDTVYKGDYGLMSVGVDPGQISGKAVIRYELWEAGSPGQKDTLTWIITAGSSTGLKETTSDLPLFIYPNPVVHELVNIRALADMDFSLNDLSGKQIQAGTLKKGLNAIPVKNLPKGNYFINVRSKEGQFFTQTLIIQ